MHCIFNLVSNKVRAFEEFGYSCGTIVLFDRKVLRNFRKDGHNWKKKKDGKTVKEAHENLKGSPVIPLNTNSTSAFSDPYGSWLLSEDTDFGAHAACYSAEKTQLGDGNGKPSFGSDPGDNMTLKNHEIRFQEINTLEWEELLVSDDFNNLSTSDRGKILFFEQQNQYETNGFTSNDNILSGNEFPAQNSFRSSSQPDSQISPIHFNISGNPSFQKMEGQTNPDFGEKDGLQMHASFGRLMNYVMKDSPGSVDDPSLEPSILSGHELSVSPMMGHPQSSFPGQIFSVTDVSPAWGFSTEETKVFSFVTIV
ncbi:hypothetical protein U1Q18_042280 [Sarracenia purpurea var. burkii]